MRNGSSRRGKWIEELESRRLLSASVPNLTGGEWEGILLNPSSTTAEWFTVEISRQKSDGVIKGTLIINTSGKHKHTTNTTTSVFTGTIDGDEISLTADNGATMTATINDDLLVSGNFNGGRHKSAGYFSMQNTVNPTGRTKPIDVGTLPN